LGYEGTRHLIELGHTGIIYHGGTTHPTGRERAFGYVRAMKEAGLTPRLFNVYYRQDDMILPEFQPYFDLENTAEVLFNEMIQHKISAVFSFNDDGAAWLHNEMRKYNLVTPRDISLVSVDNLPYHAFLEAPLTTFVLPGEEMGKQAAELLLRRISGESFPPQRVLIPARFIQRFSTAPPFTQERVSKLNAN
jgi:LacI family transcriptional regulator